jgi:hypothetical protein
MLSVLDPVLMLAEGTEMAALAYNRVQNNGEMLHLGQALMMLQSGTPRHYFTREREREREKSFKVAYVRGYQNVSISS